MKGRARKPVAVDRLAPETLSELQQVLGSDGGRTVRTRFTPAPSPLAYALYALGCSWTRYASAIRPQSDSEVRAEFKALRDAAAALILQFSGLSQSARMHLLHHDAKDRAREAFARERGIEPNAGKAGDAAMRALGAFGALLDELATPVPHRSKDVQKRGFALQVAMVLANAGVRPTSAKTGKFSQVLEVLLFRIAEAQGKPTRANAERLVRETLATLRDPELETTEPPKHP